MSCKTSGHSSKHKQNLLVQPEHKGHSRDSIKPMQQFPKAPLMVFQSTAVRWQDFDETVIELRTPGKHWVFVCMKKLGFKFLFFPGSKGVGLTDF